jgi:hypothetical protein
MNRLTIAKLAFALAGIAIFAYGARVDDGTIRWVGIAFVVVAFLLRFAKRPDRDTTV